MDASETEQRACELAYEHAHGVKVVFSEIPEEECEVILKRIRERVLQIEQFATHNMLVRRIGEQRRTPQRFMGPAVVTALVMGALILLGLGIMQLVAGH